ncbi:MAG: lysylphosphatidylglycerol synthase domain-containing protein [Cyclobacteriaceae bacterium]
MIGWIVRLLILAVCTWFIVSKVGEKWQFDSELLTGKMPMLLIVMVLAFVNWWLEVWRWKYSLKQIGNCTWSEASRQVFAGLTLNWIMPFTSGDLMARLIPNKERKQVGLLIYYNRAIMLAMTIIFGMFGVYWYSTEQFASNILIVLFALLGLIALGFLAKKVLGRGESITSKWLLNLSLISIARYAVFVFQFLLLIKVFNPEFSIFLILAGVGWVFLFRSVIPSLFGNLGVREASALVFFEGLVDNMALILVPSLLIWLVNTVMPSVLGLYYLIRFPVKIAE